MKIVACHRLIECGEFAFSQRYSEVRDEVLQSIWAVDWPQGSGRFSIYPEKGKRRGEGNGVKPIKRVAMDRLRAFGWEIEMPWPVGERLRPGNMDAGRETSDGLISFEWETGNISSSHRSLNKLCLGLLTGKVIAGFLVVPSRALYPYLTDRIGNVAELEPYFPLWSSIPCAAGSLEVIVVEHDELSESVPRIPKGTDGRAIT